MDTFVIGCGSGRCGTMSLSSLLTRQPDAEVTHERFGHRVRWGAPWATWALKLWKFCRQEDGIRGDVAFYWLPQIEWFLEQGRETEVSVRVIGLKRDREETIRSYERKVGDQDHWRYHAGEGDYRHTEWSKCHPIFEADSREAAIGQYWDYYYQRLESLEGSHSEVRIWRTEALNDPERLSEILEFVGVSDPAVKTGIRRNQT